MNINSDFGVILAEMFKNVCGGGYKGFSGVPPFKQAHNGKAIVRRVGKAKKSDNQEPMRRVVFINISGKAVHGKRWFGRNFAKIAKRGNKPD